MPPRRPQNESSASSWWLVVIVAIAIAAGLYYWWQRAGAPSPELAGGPAPTSQSGGGFAPADGPEADGEKLADAQPPPEDAPKPAAGPKHPLPESVAKDDDPSLPELARSDEPILESLTGIAPRTDLGRFGNIGDFTRRVVITVDNLPRERVPTQYSVVQRIPGALAVGKEGEAIVLGPENYRRYNAFVGFAESVGARQLAQ